MVFFFFVHNGILIVISIDLFSVRNCRSVWFEFRSGWQSGVDAAKDERFALLSGVWFVRGHHSSITSVSSKNKKRERERASGLSCVCLRLGVVAERCGSRWRWPESALVLVIESYIACGAAGWAGGHILSRCGECATGLRVSVRAFDLPRALVFLLYYAFASRYSRDTRRFHLLRHF